MSYDPYQSPTEHEPLQPDLSQLSARQQPTCLDDLRWSYPEVSYLRYPFSSFLALILAAALTVVLWIALIVLWESSVVGEIVSAILGCLAYVVIIVALFTIMWFFQTGALTSMMIAFVMWCHLGIIAVILLAFFAEGGYEMQLTFLGIPCIALPIAVLHGATVGLLRGRAF